MAVFTEVSPEQAQALLRTLGLGELRGLRGIQDGIENSNFFVTTDQGDFVLTLFERLTAQQLPFYLHLMQHLARRGIPVPEPAADGTGNLLHELCGKPAAVVNRLAGASELAPGPGHCAAMGDMLARMHLAGHDYERTQPNLRGLDWWQRTAPVVAPYLDAPQAALLAGELAFQQHTAGGSAYLALPRGAIHGDLFRDNAMFEDGRLTGLFDFYFAGVDSWLYDIAVCLNDWCVDLRTGAPEPARAAALLDGYGARRALTSAERRLLPAMLRAAALRFWISRLWDFHVPRQAALLKPHDPAQYERILRGRMSRPAIF